MFAHHSLSRVELFVVRSLEGISTIDEMVSFVESLQGFPQQNLTIVGGGDARHSTEVQTALDRMNATADGRSISFG